MSNITVRFFASLREQHGRDKEQVDAVGLRCVADVWSRVCAVPLPANILIAINQEYASPTSAVQAGDEVAFFPPVTGG
jgi:molybdopterin synthase sulfur carrier subunit